MANWIKRFTVPTKFDAAPYGTICKVTKDNEDEYELYIQAGPEEANWLRLGAVLEVAMEKDCENEEFIYLALSKYLKNT